MLGKKGSLLLKAAIFKQFLLVSFPSSGKLLFIDLLITSCVLSVSAIIGWFDYGVPH